MQPSKKRRMLDIDSGRSTEHREALPPDTTRVGENSGSIQDWTDRAGVGPTYTIFHHVNCPRQDRFHEDHEANANYHDVPFLPANSNRMTGLCGRHRLPRLENYLEDHVNLSFIVHKTYDCEAYHTGIRNTFDRLPMPQMNDDDAYQTKAYFYVLRDDAQAANPHTESLIPSEGLQRALNLLRKVREETFDKKEGAIVEIPNLTNLLFPYIEIYYQRQSLVDIAIKYLPSDEQHHIATLTNYLEACVGSEYDEAAYLFNRGRVNRKHWTKLYPPGTVIAEHRSIEPTAYLLTACSISGHDTLHLKCWSWGRSMENSSNLK